MPTVAEFSSTLLELDRKLILYKQNISASATLMLSTNPYTSSNKIQSQATIESLNQEASEYDRKFEAAQYKFKASGGKSRKQTLQEFVILFFFVGYALLTVSLILYGRAVGISTGKIFGGMFFLMLIIAGIIIRYA